MIIKEYGMSVWEDIEKRANLTTVRWTNFEFYPDENFFDIVKKAAELPDLNTEKVHRNDDGIARVGYC